MSVKVNDPMHAALARYLLAADRHSEVVRQTPNTEALMRAVEAAQIAERAAKAEILNPEPRE